MVVLGGHPTSEIFVLARNPLPSGDLATYERALAPVMTMTLRPESGVRLAVTS
jgi:hypothetical protein